MSSPLQGFLWLLSDEAECSEAAHELVLRPEDPTHLWLVRDDAVIGDRDPIHQAREGRDILDRMQGLFATDGSSRYEEDAHLWRRMAVTVILAIGVGTVVALGAGVAFSGL